MPHKRSRQARRRRARRLILRLVFANTVYDRERMETVYIGDFSELPFIRGEVLSSPGYSNPLLMKVLSK